MICDTCAKAKRPARGSPVPHLCDACGWALIGTDRIRPTPDGAFLVARAEMQKAHAVPVDPALVIPAAAETLRER